MKYKLYEIVIGRASRGWVIDAHLSVATHRQFSNEWPTVSNYGFGLKPTHNLFVAVVKFWWGLRKYIKELQAIPGKYEL